MITATAELLPRKPVLTLLTSKLLAGFLIAGIVFNSMGARFSLSSKDCANAFKAAAAQSALASFFYNSNLPISIVNSIISDNIAKTHFITAGPTAPSNPKNETKNKTDNANDRAMSTPPGNNTIIRGVQDIRDKLDDSLPWHVSAFSTAKSVLVSSYLKRISAAPVFLCMFMFLLPRSSITVDKIITHHNSRAKNPIWPTPTWVFYFWTVIAKAGIQPLTSRRMFKF